MNKQSDIGRKVDKTLESLERIQKAEPMPFFYTRVRARLERYEKNVWEALGSLLSRPVVAFAGLFFILGLNAFILFKKDTEKLPSNFALQNGQLPVEEYILTVASNSYDYENLEP